MTISRQYIFLYSPIVLLTFSFAIFLTTYQLVDPNFPTWITVTGFLLLTVSIFSFVRNFKTTSVDSNFITIHRLLLPDIEIAFDDISEIEEEDFKYRGNSAYSSVYKGYYLTIRTLNTSIKTSSLNEPSYEQLRMTLKTKLGSKVRLVDKFSGDSLNWFLLSTILLPIIYLVIQIIDRIKNVC